jgi:PTH2 family peptidyl-tRNA hydrolase
VPRETPFHWADAAFVELRGMPVKLALVVRTDLGMGKGKIAAQVAHAAVTAAVRNYGHPAFGAWLRDGQPKVVLRVADADALWEVCEAARAARLPVEVIHDAGRTQIAPGTATCGAIGPAPAEAVDAVVGTLPLL